MLYDKIDKETFKKTNRISRKYNKEWKMFSGYNYIGDCSKLFQRLHPTNYYDFYVKYTKDGEETAANRKEFLQCGRSEKEIQELAMKYMKECGDTSFKLDEFVMNVYMHTIVETFDGQMKEQEVIQLLTNMGFTYEKPRGNEDSRFGIDFKVYKNNALSFVLQIKPISFFMGTHNHSLIEDRIEAFEKQSLVRKRFNVPTYYMVYKTDNDGMVEWLSENGKMCLELRRLCNQENGYPNELPKDFIKI